MKPILYLSCLISTSLFAQKVPIDYIKAVADKVIRTVPFQYRMVLAPTPDVFNFVQFVDFGRTFGTANKASAYAYSHLEALKDTSIILEVAHNDGLLVWVNGKQVYQKTGNLEVKIEHKEREIQLMDAFQVDLKKGTNTILLQATTQGNGKKWLVYLQPKGATVEFSQVKGLKLTLQTVPLIDRQVSALSNWLVCGPFDQNKIAIPGNFQMKPGQVFEGKEGPTSWTLPKLEVFGDVLNPHPLWGSLYNFNYHTAGLAWALGNLSEYTKDEKYFSYLKKYTDFMMASKPLVDYQVNALNGFRSAQHQMVHTPLLDYTAAPALPFVYRLMKEKEFTNRADIEKYVRSTQTYLSKEQVRLPDGTFTRETPEKMTTWVDDMFMGIPFLIHSALEAKEETVRKAYFDEAAKQVLGFNKAVYDPAADLYMHAQYSTRKVKIPYWSRANGWGIFAASIVLEHLPKTHPQYKAVLKIFQKHADGIARRQDAKTGFWHQVLDDPSSYEELSGTAIFTMAIARGLNQGWLDAKKYKPIALKGWEAVSSKIEEDGTVHTICIGTMSSENPDYYKTRPLVDDDSHGLIGLVFCGIEMDKLLKK